MATAADRPVRAPGRLRVAATALIAQLAKFGVVGGVAYVVDVGLFNLLSYVGSPPLLDGQPLLAKVASTGVATVVAWLGNRYWTFRHRRQRQAHHELMLFIAFNGSIVFEGA